MKILRVVLALGVIALCALFFRQIDWHALSEALRGADLNLVLLAAAINFVHIAAKSERWRVMLRPMRVIGALRAYYYLIVSYAASIVLPGRAATTCRCTRRSASSSWRNCSKGWGCCW
jgi:uncharacterized membrane protein YbhN (UPF0104 family)